MSLASFFDSLGRDLRSALRALSRRAAFTITAVLTLALGIGAVTAIFSVVNAVLIEPLPYPDSERLVSVGHVAPGLSSTELGMSPAQYFTYRDESRTFEHIGLWNAGGQSVTGVGEPEQARALWVTYGTLQALGVQPLLGRLFSEGDDTPGVDGPEPVILTYAYWQRKFGGDPAVLGRSMTIDARPSAIVGVMPERFRFLDVQPDAEIILTMRLDRARTFLGNFGRQGMAKLRAGVTVAEANADVARMLPIWLEAWPEPPQFTTRQQLESWAIVPTLIPLKDQVVGSVASALWVLMGAIGAVLLIACANVANLMLVRADARRKELAIRAALGADRGRLAKELFVESFVLGVIGGAVGFVLAYAGLKILVAVGPASIPRLGEISIDLAVLAFAVAVSLASSVLFGAVPSLKYARTGAPLTGTGARAATASRTSNRMRNALVIVQVALALVLVVSSALMIRTFHALRDVDPGFAQPAEIQVARIWTAPFVGNDPARYTQIQRSILDMIAALPGVESAAFGIGAPMENRYFPNVLYVEDRTYEGEPPVRYNKPVSPGWFETMGTPLVAGREFSWADIDAGGKVAVISANLARELWGEPAAAIGKRVRESPPDAPGIWREVIGVVQDVHEDALHRPPPSIVYWPVLMEGFLGQPNFGTQAIAYAIRSERAGSATLVNEVRQAVWSVNGDLPVFLVRTMQDLYAASLERTSFTLVMLGIAGAMALGLGLVGIAGVMAYVVSQRTREIGIRAALGARPRLLERMFLLHGLALSGVGVFVGLVAAMALARLMSSLLYGIGPLDPTAHITAVGVTLATAALASYLPARRAATIDPMETLKAE
jgi:predicted permease